MSEDQPRHRVLNYVAPRAFSMEGERAGLTYCLDCGAAIFLCQGEPNPLRIHDEWHRKMKEARGSPRREPERGSEGEHGGGGLI